MHPTFTKNLESSDMYPHVDSLHELLHGGKEITEEIRKHRVYMKANGIGKLPLQVEMSRVDVIADTIRSSVHKKFDAFNDQTTIIGQLPPVIYCDQQDHLIGSVGQIMSRKLIDLTGTDEQKARWLKFIDRHLYVCAYVQTELAHGSDVQGLKTVATFDTETKDFVLHSPDLDSMKWWPGDIAVYSNHIVVFAKLIVNGKDYGSQAFFIQVRDLDTHKVLEGIEVGDIGPKLGYATKDNGYMSFNKLHIPLDSLLGRFITVDKKGNVTKRGNPKILYGGMMEMRTKLLAISSTVLMRCAHIATRYSYIRTQFKDKTGDEIPIIKYQMQQDKLTKQIVRGYAMSVSAYEVARQVVANEAKISKGNFSNLQHLHVLICGHKAIHTEYATYGIQYMIRACGGHGFNAFSGMTGYFVEQFPDMILEGENSVLFLQVSRSLLKNLNYSQTGRFEKIISQFKYLTEDQSSFNLPPTQAGINNADNLLKVFEKTIFYQVMNVGMSVMEAIKEGNSPVDAFNYKLGLRVSELGKLHSLYMVCKNFQTGLNSQVENKELRQFLEKVLVLFIIDSIECEMLKILEADAMSQLHMSSLLKVKEQLTQDLTPHLLVLVEAMKLEDWNTQSCIGHENGKPYDNLYEAARTMGALNQYKDSIHPAISEYYLPWRKSVSLGKFESSLPGGGYSAPQYNQQDMQMKAKL